jgi:hypothetical protein
MKLKMTVLAIAAAALTASAAFAAPPAGKGKPPTTGAGCKPQVSVILTGTVATAPGATPTLPFALSVTVSHANHQGKAYAKLTQPISVTVTTDTKIHRKGANTLSSLLAGDRVTIHARACKADLKSTDPAVATATLTATKIDAHPAKPAKP